MGLSERELDEITQRHAKGTEYGWTTRDYCTFCTELETVVWPCDAMRAVAEVRRLREVLVMCRDLAQAEIDAGLATYAWTKVRVRAGDALEPVEDQSAPQ